MSKYADLRHTDNPTYMNSTDETIHTLLVEPVDGPTVREETLNEWFTGQLFKVVYTSLPLKKHSLITEQELLRFFPLHNVEVDFKTLSHAEWQETYGVHTDFQPMAVKLEALREKYNG